METFQVRSARPNDVGAIHAIRRDAILGIEIQSDLERGLRQVWADKRSPEFFAERVAAGDAVIASLSGHDVGWGSSTGDRITAVYVRCSHGRSGVGRLLMSALEAAIEARGHAYARLESSANAIGFYVKLGYAQTGAPQPDGLPMARRLRPPD